MEKKSLPYVFEFEPHQLDEIRECNKKHGFAVVKGLINEDHVERLKAEVRRVLEPRCSTEHGAGSVSINFIEESPEYAKILQYEPFMQVASYLNDDEPMTLVRSAAIYKKPGAGVHNWHTDWAPVEYPYTVDSFLNTMGAASLWFYLNGTHPSRAGLAIIPDSHTADWPGQEGFELANRSFHRKGTTPRAYSEFDFPEVFPLYTDPGDLIIFADRTYHAVFPHNGDETRLSCGLALRKSSIRPALAGWPITETAKQFIASSPAEIRPLLEEYTGLDRQWVEEYNRNYARQNTEP